MTLVGLTLGFYLIATSLAEVVRRVRPAGDTSIFKRFRRIKRSDWGMTLAHAGLGVLVLGIVASEAWTTEKILALKPGEQVDVAGYDVTFRGTLPVIGPNYTAIGGVFDVSENGEMLKRLISENRLYADPVQPTTEAAILPLLSGDIYAIIGEEVGDGRWRAHLYFKPLISGLWLGSLMMVLGGLMSLFDRRLRLGTVRKDKEKAS